MCMADFNDGLVVKLGLEPDEPLSPTKLARQNSSLREQARRRRLAHFTPLGLWAVGLGSAARRAARASVPAASATRRDARHLFPLWPCTLA